MTSSSIEGISSETANRRANASSTATAPATATANANPPTAVASTGTGHRVESVSVSPLTMERARSPGTSPPASRMAYVIAAITATTWAATRSGHHRPIMSSPTASESTGIRAIVHWLYPGSNTRSIW